MFTFKTQNEHDKQPSFGALLRPGFYNAKIVGVVAETSQAGNPQLKLTVEVYASNTTLQLTEWMTLTQKSAWKIERWMAAVGYEFGKGQQVDVDERTFAGKRLVVLTYMTPGKEPNSDGTEKLFVSIMRAMRPQDCPCIGELQPEEYATYGLAPDGTDIHRPRAKAPQANNWNKPVAAASKPAPKGWSTGRNTNYNYTEEDNLGF